MTDTRETALAHKLHRNLRLLAGLTIIFLLVLAAVPAKSYFSQWRQIQSGYNTKAAAAGLPPMKAGLKQIWRAEIERADRCITCHVGHGAAKPIEDGGILYGPHPQVHHDVRQMGCTICHRGQGRSTTADKAHGNVKHWEDPMLPTGLVQASCGYCHATSHVTLSSELVEEGEYLFDLHGCSGCHTRNGGDWIGPDLGAIALKGYDRAWQIQHLRAPTSTTKGSRMMSFGHLTDHEVDAIVTYLDTLIGAPKLQRGRVLARKHGCRGCHDIGGVGGEHGMALSEAAAIPAADRDFGGVTGAHTNENWHRQHLRNPKRVSRESKMPVFELSEADEDALLTFIFSNRDPEVPLELLPKKRAVQQLRASRDFEVDGPSLFAVFCSSCHENGKSRAMESLDATVPDVTNPSMLATATDAFLRDTIKDGRPGRDMPAWGAILSAQEIDTLVDYLRGHEPAAPTFAEVRAINGDARIGRSTFNGQCAGCHGLDGEGTQIAPSLANEEFLFVADDQYLYDTIVLGRSAGGMPAHPELKAEILAGLIAFLRITEVDAPRAKVLKQEISAALHVGELADYKAAGSHAYGKMLYVSNCIGCHGEAGEGGVGPAIGTHQFARIASDGFIAGSMVLGRGGRAMRAFGRYGISPLSYREIGDIISYLRFVAAGQAQTPIGPKVQGVTTTGKAAYNTYCVGCHGEEGVGKSGPALNNPGFLASATDGFLQATIARGRNGTAMRGWTFGGNSIVELEPKTVNDIVAYIRSWQNGRGH